MERDRPLRVLLVVGRSTGGIGTHVADLATRLRHLGVEVRIATDDLTADRFGWSAALRVWPGRGGLAARAGRVVELRRWCGGADIVHAHGQQAGILAAALLGPRSAGPPRTGETRRRGRGRGTPRLVISLHNDPPPLGGPAGLLAGGVLGRALARADLVAGASSDLVGRATAAGATRAQLAEVPSPRVPGLLAADATVRAEARHGIRQELGIADGTSLVLTVSRIAPQKDLATLVDAADRIEAPILWIVAGSGDADLLAGLRARVAESAAPVRFVGAIPDPGRMLLAADVFALTSRWEARALVVQEAMAAGVPVVAPAVGGLPDLLTGAGQIVPQGDSNALAAAIDAVLGDGPGAAAMAARARARAGTWLDGDGAARRWLRIYRDLADVTYS
ncbi:MAG: glycosyltransferase family 4 protein [Dermatophilaceae bacterium]